MAHYTTGLPKLDLEPFDPTPLYAAARSPRRDKDQPSHRTNRRPIYTIVIAVASLASAAGVAGYLFL